MLVAGYIGILNEMFVNSEFRFRQKLYLRPQCVVLSYYYFLVVLSISAVVNNESQSGLTKRRGFEAVEPN